MNIIIISHERSGTHLISNLINKNHIFIGEYNKEYVKDFIYDNIETKGILFKSHHTIDYYEDFIDFLFQNYKIIYIQRDIKDTLLSYYRFQREEDLEKFSLKNIDRIIKHREGWFEYKDRFLIINYEDILNNFEKEKIRIENYIENKILDFIPNINDKDFITIEPNEGKIGTHKKYMSKKLIKKINDYLDNGK